MQLIAESCTEPPRYSYVSKTVEQDELMRMVDTAYRQDLVRISTMIHAKHRLQSASSREHFSLRRATTNDSRTLHPDLRHDTPLRNATTASFCQGSKEASPLEWLVLRWIEHFQHLCSCRSPALPRYRSLYLSTTVLSFCSLALTREMFGCSHCAYFPFSVYSERFFGRTPPAPDKLNCELVEWF
ncbi:MAG: hypothetical protein JWQ49_4297 [Edaphobacter sp.]|nr:hypothetical protein [Edaphobacter sp.]